jgi:phosphopantetheinyl transferase
MQNQKYRFPIQELESCLVWNAKKALTCLARNGLSGWVIDSSAGPVESFTETRLSPEELLRKKRFCVRKDARNFALGRALVRDVIACYLGMTKGYSQIPLRQTAAKKPYCPLIPRLNFNITHS